ncbi:MAG: hypothetical protein LBP34_08830 [Flavobacteriaceae bacterium]|jgi:hypothetical protein|nr:hypothetical protein [Flavobacteriaceae bacterium]
MKKQQFILSLLLFISTINLVYSQEIPNGKIIARGFLDYNTNFTDKNGFDITRAFLGYNYKFSPTLQGRVIVDGASGKSSSGKLEPYIRNAYINWKDAGFNINVGLTGLLQFSLQEDYWTHRYILKSFQDLNSFASSVDLGFTAEYEISPIISVDFSLTNGEGYKEVKSDNNLRYGAGISLKPIKNTILRVYADYYNKSIDTLSIKRNDQSDLSLFAGYQSEKISAGAEYNHQFNRDFIDGKDFYGYSLYSSVRIAPKWKAFARYDRTDSSNPPSYTSPWNKLDGQLLMFGIEFQPVKQIKIAPNFRNFNYDRGDSEQFFFINAEFNL